MKAFGSMGGYSVTMKTLAFLRVAALAALSLAGSGVAASAQPSGTAAPVTTMRLAPRLVRVTQCDPQRSVAVPAYVGYSSGYYPFAPYYWTDPYGFQYRQFPTMPTSATLSIDYTNITGKVMTTIDFGLVARGLLVAEVRDVGKFSPNAEIKHQFGLSSNVFPLQTALARCVPLHVIYADGTTWTNPRLPKLRREIYGD
jgi:hypothetical protein